MILLSLTALTAMALPLAYLYMLVVGALRKPLLLAGESAHRFALLVPAHNEAAVIEDTVLCLRSLSYPSELYDVYVVADHCTDATADLARRAGASCYVREELPNRSKGAALNWLLAKIGTVNGHYDAFVFFDADSRPGKDFLSYMSAHLKSGDIAIQGREVVSNPGDGWYPALRSAMVIVDERISQRGRSNLNFSARVSGFGFCAAATLLDAVPWPVGLTEDIEFRLLLLERGHRVVYEPQAYVEAEAAPSWQAANQER